MKHQVEIFDSEAPSNLDILVGMVSKTANEEGTGWLQTITIRMPMTVACTFDALAKHSGQSRNKLVVKALESALDMLWEQLPEAERDTVEELRGDLMNYKIDAKEGESGSI